MPCASSSAEKTSPKKQKVPIIFVVFSDRVFIFGKHKSFVHLVTMKSFCVVGLMSGTSLDGLDMACVEFTLQRGKWKYVITAAETIGYNKALLLRLSEADQLLASGLAELDAWYGKWMGIQVNRFIAKHRLKPTLLSSHGHTVFHQPSFGFSHQIGSGSALAASTGIRTVCDFRSMDVALGGQGAPLVPIGDELLFREYEYCLNLGGFANISYRKKEKRMAYDTCPVNIVLNHLSRKLNKPYDKDGVMARKGKPDALLLEKLNASSFFQKRGPKSLGKEWVQKSVIPMLDKSKVPVADQLRTYVEHIAFQISSKIEHPKARVLVTGGGVYNRFLMETISTLSRARFVIPGDTLIQFKEALIFSFLGVLRVRGEINSLKSVTGASRDSVGGCVYEGKQTGVK
jgi:anhydro-N-acetylmuramic acid kinase